MDYFCALDFSALNYDQGKSDEANFSKANEEHRLCFSQALSKEFQISLQVDANQKNMQGTLNNLIVEYTNKVTADPTYGHIHAKKVEFVKLLMRTFDEMVKLDSQQPLLPGIGSLADFVAAIKMVWLSEGMLSNTVQDRSDIEVHPLAKSLFKNFYENQKKPALYLTRRGALINGIFPVKLDDFGRFSFALKWQEISPVNKRDVVVSRANEENIVALDESSEKVSNILGSAVVPQNQEVSPQQLVTPHLTHFPPEKYKSSNVEASKEVGAFVIK